MSGALPCQTSESCETCEPAKPTRGRRPKAGTTLQTKAVARGVKAVYDVAAGEVPAPENETVIIKLDVQASAVAPGMDGPTAYNGFDEDMGRSQFAQATMVDNQPRTCEKPVDARPDSTGGTMKAIRLLMDFDEKCKSGEWPASTSVHCYWCCHRFSGVPIGIPLSYNEDAGKFMVYGCFCSCECAAAYNLDSHESSDEIMTRHGYLNMLARELGHKDLVRPAPSRLVLSMFGGPMGIDDFRERCLTSRLLLVNFPPMMTVTQQVEEINQRELRSEYRYIPLDSDRVNKYKEKIKLKRTKPLVNFKNTLDHTMNLKFA
jgi:hypothetical protein